MTIDDESSVYVGGLPYDATEDSVRRVFDLYGAVVAVKIVNDNTSRGKCYGFVTFRNPRSAIDAINDMDGRSVDGRVVRVNEVRTRGISGGERGGGGRGRLGFGRGRENLRRGFERGRNWDGRGEMEYENVRERYNKDRYSDRSVEWYGGHRHRSRERDLRRSVEYVEEEGYDERGRHEDRGIVSEHYSDRDRERDREVEDGEQGDSRSREQGWGKRNCGVESDRETEVERTDRRSIVADEDREQQSRRWNGSSSIDRKSREIVSHSSDEVNDQVKEELDRSTRRLQESKEEEKLRIRKANTSALNRGAVAALLTSHMEERLEQEGKLVLDLQKKSKKLEDALVNAKKNTSRQKTQLTKLHSCFMQVKDYREKLKSSEDELQMLVEMATGDDDIDDVGLRDKLLIIGNA